MNRSLLLTAGLVCSLSFWKVTAQTAEVDYTNALGLRLGETSGITFNHKFDEQNSIKFIGGVFPDVYGLTILYERFYPTKAKGLDFYFGAGGHVSGAYQRTRDYYIIDRKRYSYERNYGYSSIFGVDILTGIEYKFPKVPIALSTEVKPFIEFFNGYGPYFKLDPGIVIKYVF
jgi:hypothetical protein